MQHFEFSQEISMLMFSTFSKKTDFTKNQELTRRRLAEASPFSLNPESPMQSTNDVDWRIDDRPGGMRVAIEYKNESNKNEHMFKISLLPRATLRLLQRKQLHAV